MSAKLLLLRDFVHGAFTHGLEATLHAGLDKGKRFASTRRIPLAIQFEHGFALRRVDEVLRSLPRCQLLFHSLILVVIQLFLFTVIVLTVTGIVKILLAHLHGT